MPCSHSHSDHHHHSHGDGEEQAALLDALRGQGDKGSLVTLIGLGSNIILTLIKGIAGYVLSSASLIADAGHSLSDLMGDLITLFCWNWSKKPKDDHYQFGYGKYESIGSLIVAFFLISGGLGIGFHSYSLFLSALKSQVDQSGLMSNLLAFLPHSISLPHTHSHSHGSEDSLDHSVDFRAAYFALLSVVVKEWLYRMTYRVGKAEESNVLLANALHHRSDAFGSLVALLAIIGSSFGLTILDPIGGFIVCVMILSSGLEIGRKSFYELVDRSPHQTLETDLKNLLNTSFERKDKLIDWSAIQEVLKIRCLRSGSRLMIFLEVKVTNHQLSLRELVLMEVMLSKTIKKEKKNVEEVMVSFRA
ncbi:cation efflux protein [Melampsora americana]|nr:cation efflux protein [Melampsora americana]